MDVAMPTEWVGIIIFTGLWIITLMALVIYWRMKDQIENDQVLPTKFEEEE